ncbi:PAS domain S-box protein [Erythrobacteraceae bacterium CFH 75059]|uniref:sensor histidine kinase n=1 Tax=Qipengyuania thermophila TaxID=2509361 RepID=UPI00101F8D97|nr:ATP-binding protein [Qipengyuania thermophila]TCD06671.1 PAS domain S-box protein [Erythrobacteraceae bacterium CFH 75059]
MPAPFRLPTRLWTDRPLTFKGVVVVAVPLLVLLAALVSLYGASTAEVQAEDDVRRAFAIQRDTHRVHALLAEAAAGVRGYALTREEQFLDRYRQAEAELPATMARLDGAIRDPQVRARFERLRGLTARKQEGLRQIAALAERSPDTAELRRALRANTQVLDAMRAEIDALQQRESVLLAERTARVEDVRGRFLVVTAISAVLGLLGSLAAVYLFSTGIVRRVRVLEHNATRLARGEALGEQPAESDEIGRLAQRLARASALLRAREHALRESEERFRLVVDQVRDYGIFALDADGLVVSWNQGAERIKGWRAGEILGQHFSRFYPPETRAHRPAEMLAQARRHGTAEDEGWRVRRDGSRFWANVVITALRDEHGALRGFAKVTRDISERHRAEETLRLAREEAVAASDAKSVFLSRTSHELRTPLSAILGFGQLLELDADDLPERHRAAVTHIMAAARHLLALIDDLLDISAIEAGGAELRAEALDLEAVCRQAASLAAPIVAGAGLRLTVDPPRRPLRVVADRRRVVQVILNLLANAAKYHGNGTTVTLTARQEGASACIIVEDDGVGIDPAHAPRLFTAFDRLGQERRSNVEGTGLGLALSRSMVQSMGGAMAHERPDRGARFWFTLPLAPPDIPAPRRSEETEV